MSGHVISLRDPSGTALLAMVAKRAYRLARGRLMAVSEAGLLDEAPQYAASTNPGALALLLQDSDLIACLKPATDVLLRGSAHSTRGFVRSLDTAGPGGTLRKNVRAFGDRTLGLGPAGRPRFSDPVPFQSLPLVWDNAYGGRDLHAEGKLAPKKRPFARRDEAPRGALVYPRNGAGRGFFLDLERERIEGAQAPNLEAPEDPVTPDRLLAKDPLDWLDRPAAACYEAVDWLSFPRLAFWLGARAHAPARPLHEARMGVLGLADLLDRPPFRAPDPRAYNCAPAGLSGTRLQGHERVRLTGLHPRHETLEFDLPGERPSLLVEPPGCGVYELSPRLQTVLLEPEQERVTLTWTGHMAVAAPYAREACDAMRSAVRWQR